MGKEVYYCVKSSIRNSLWSLCSLCVCYLVTKPCMTLVVLCTVACQAPLSMEFPRKESWSGLLFLSPANLPDPGLEAGSPALQAHCLLTKPPVL